MGGPDQNQSNKFIRWDAMPIMHESLPKKSGGKSHYVKLKLRMLDIQVRKFREKTPSVVKYQVFKFLEVSLGKWSSLA